MRTLIEQHPRAASVAILALAAVLIGTAVVMATGLLVDSETADVTTRSPGASEPGTPAPTSSGQPATLQPSPTPAPADHDRPLLVTALVDSLRIRDEPGDGDVVGRMQAGDLAWVEDGPRLVDGSDWWFVRAGLELYGWVSAGPVDGERYLQLHSITPWLQPPSITGLAAGESGFLAWGTDATRSDHAEPGFVLASTDGATWRSASLPITIDDPGYVSAAWADAGWLLTVGGSPDETPALIGSQNGESWTQLPAFPQEGVWFGSLTGTPAGYLVEARDSDTGAQRLYFSPDGREWQETHPAAATGDVGYGLAGASGGFVAWRQLDDSTVFYRSTDGLNWHQLGAPFGDILMPTLGGAAADDLWMVAIDLSGTRSVWRIAPDTSGAAWIRQSASEASVMGAAVLQLLSNDSSTLAIGASLVDGSARMWQIDGDRWQPLDASSLPGGRAPTIVAAGGNGFAALVPAVKGVGPHPVLWSAANGIDWSEAPAVLEPIQSYLVQPCPPLPQTFAEWATIAGPVGVECFGDQPMTFSAWLTVGGGCGGAYAGSYEPGWLASPFAFSQIVLEAFPADYGGCGSAAQHPSLTQLPEPQQWVEVTGHFDDPAAATCRYLIDPQYPVGAPSHEALVWGCRNRFVATAIVPRD